MRLGMFLKVSAMMAALVMVLMLGRGLNSGSVEKAFQALGIEPGTPKSPGLQPGGRALSAGEERFIICRTRIVSISWAPDRRIEERQEGLKLIWMAHDPAPREIGTLAVEKWLSLHCQVTVKPITVADAGARPRETITLGYVDGTKAVVRRFMGARFDLHDLGEVRPMRSPDLEAAFEELAKIAQFQVTAEPAAGP